MLLNGRKVPLFSLTLINDTQKDLSADLFSDQSLRGLRKTDIANIKQSTNTEGSQLSGSISEIRFMKQVWFRLKARKKSLHSTKVKPSVIFQRNKTFKTSYLKMQ